MFIERIKIKNFRLLKDVELKLEENITLIVGRNNSGKTSITEIFWRILERNPLQLIDFSLQIHKKFFDAYILYYQGKDELEIRNTLPVVEVQLIVNYEKDKELGILGDFIVDLNPDCKKTFIRIQYQLDEGKIESFFNDITYDETADVEKQKIDFYKKIKDRIADYYKYIVYAEDPNDSKNQKKIDFTELQSLIKSNFISAQRGLDDTTYKEINQLGKIIEDLYKLAKSETTDTEEKVAMENLEKFVEELQENIDRDFKKELKSLFPSFETFGYPGLVDPKLLTETNINLDNLINREHTKVLYAGANGVNFPESYNGLGVRNLIYILLKLHELAKKIKSEKKTPGLCLVFIEEPEVHLHPQMQQVFINKLNEIFRKFYDVKPLIVQFIITTHSSHIANEAPFQTIRYFLVKPDNEVKDINVCYTKIKDLHDELFEDEDFLHKYMTLTRCDLLFADKVILIEGASERIMLPKMIEKLEKGQIDIKQKLSSQYISTVEVGGAFAHLFFKLLNFLELKTLIITDLDSIGDDRKESIFSNSKYTSNETIKKWFNDSEISPNDLIKKSEMEKIKGINRIAFEVPEEYEAPCGRSFEDTFILANYKMFNIEGTNNREKEKEALEKSKKFIKTDFALEHALIKTDWIVPRYIYESLTWFVKEEKC